MDLFSKKEIKKLLKKYQVSPSKKLGQNFLIDKSAVKKIMDAADLKPKDTVLEIGPGIGTLTRELARKAKGVVAIEKDLKMIEVLNETLKDFNNIKVIQGDVRKIDIKHYLSDKNYKIVGNLPFYLTAPVIRNFLESKNPPREMILVVQKEVGQRICAKHGKMSILAVSVQVYAEPKIISYISKKSFWPQPKVNSAIIKITPFDAVRSDRIYLRQNEKEKFFQIVKAGFSQPRKQLINNLSKKLGMNRERVKKWLLENNIQPTRRAETLSVKDWIKLTKSFKPR